MAKHMHAKKQLRVVIDIHDDVIAKRLFLEILSSRKLEKPPT
jgi:hypothetical protein